MVVSSLLLHPPNPNVYGCPCSQPLAEINDNTQLDLRRAIIARTCVNDNGIAVRETLPC